MPIFGIGLPGEGYASAASRRVNDYQNLQKQLIAKSLNQQNDPYGMAQQSRDRIMAAAQSGIGRIQQSPNVNMNNLAAILRARGAAAGSEAYNTTLEEQLRRKIALQLQAAGLYGGMADTAFNQQQVYNQQTANAGNQIGQLIGIGAQYGPGWFGKAGVK